MKQPEVEKFDLLSSQIFLGEGAIEYLPQILDRSVKQGRRCFLLSDENTHSLCLPVLKSYLPPDLPEFVLVPGETSKTLENAERIWKWLLELNAGKDEVLLNLGGGVVSDLGGFVASSYKRGMAYINIPTTLMGQVDASVGGKTSVNLLMAKNQVGSFYHPHAIIIDPVFLKTLPGDHSRSGYAEILKSALLSGKERWNRARETKWELIKEWDYLIRDTVKMKAMVVARDPHDNGVRNILNFGHTLGHAFEAVSLEKYPPGLFHGDAIALGMVGELFISWRMGHICWSDMIEVSAYLRENFPVPPFSINDKDKLMEVVMKDKKIDSRSLKISTLKKIGEPLWGIECSDEHMVKAIDYVLKDNTA